MSNEIIKTWDDPTVTHGPELHRSILLGIKNSLVTVVEIIDNPICAEAQAKNGALLLGIEKGGKIIRLKFEDPELYEQGCSALGLDPQAGQPEKDPIPVHAKPVDVVQVEEPKKEPLPELFQADVDPLSGLDEEPIVSPVTLAEVITPEVITQPEPLPEPVKPKKEKKVRMAEVSATSTINPVDLPQTKHGLSSTEYSVQLMSEILETVKRMEARIGVLTGQLAEPGQAKAVTGSGESLSKAACRLVKDSDGKIQREILETELNTVYPGTHPTTIVNAINRAFSMHKRGELND